MCCCSLQLCKGRHTLRCYFCRCYLSAVLLPAGPAAGIKTPLHALVLVLSAYLTKLFSGGGVTPPSHLRRHRPTPRGTHTHTLSSPTHTYTPPPPSTAHTQSTVHGNFKVLILLGTQRYFSVSFSLMVSLVPFTRGKSPISFTNKSLFDLFYKLSFTAFTPRSPSQPFFILFAVLDNRLRSLSQTLSSQSLSQMDILRSPSQTSNILSPIQADGV